MYDLIKKQITDKMAEIQLVKSKLEDIDVKAEQVNGRYNVVCRCQELAQIVAQGIQQKVHEKIASVVSKCLEAVFDEPYKFNIKFERKRGKTEARLVFERDGIDIDDPLTGCGGGVIDVASFALRLSAIMLSKPQSRRIMIMDEPFRFLSLKYRPKVKDLLIQLRKEYDFQFIIVTHASELVVGKVIEI